MPNKSELNISPEKWGLIAGSLFQQLTNIETILKGTSDWMLQISRVELDVCFTQPTHEERLSIDDFRKCIDGKSSGAVRISVGMVTNFNDVQGFLAFARGLLT